MLQELGEPVPRIHELRPLVDILLPHDRTLRSIRRGLKGLSHHAVEYRYPGKRTTTRQMQAALRLAERVRSEIRLRLRLTT